MRAATKGTIYLGEAAAWRRWRDGWDKKESHYNGSLIVRTRLRICRQCRAEIALRGEEQDCPCHRCPVRVLGLDDGCLPEKESFTPAQALSSHRRRREKPVSWAALMEPAAARGRRGGTADRRR